MLQRKLHLHKGDVADELHVVGGHVQNAVDDAMVTIAADPTLSDYVKTDTSGYIRLWIDTYAQFLATPAVIPPFFYARYGYAVETIATKLLRNVDIEPYSFRFQVAHGHTRPDVVVVAGSAEVAWIDLTSEASRGHIFRKQGGGWKTRAYVAEACYEMPLPSALALGAKDLDEDTRQRLAAATKHAAEREGFFEIGRQEIGAEIAAALEAAYTTWGSLSKTFAKEVIHGEARRRLGEDTTAALTKSILAMLDVIEVGEESSDGQAWANWAFKDLKVTSELAKERLIIYGGQIASGTKPEPAASRVSIGSRLRKQQAKPKPKPKTTTRSGRVVKPDHKQKKKVRAKSKRKQTTSTLREVKRRG